MAIFPNHQGLLEKTGNDGINNKKKNLHVWNYSVHDNDLL